MTPLRRTTGLTLRRNPPHRTLADRKPAIAPPRARWASFGRQLLACAAALTLLLSATAGSLAQEPAAELSDVQRTIRSTLQDRNPQVPVPVAQAAEMLVNV